MATEGPSVLCVDTTKQKRTKNEEHEWSPDTHSDCNDQNNRLAMHQDQGPSSPKRCKVTEEPASVATKGVLGNLEEAANISDATVPGEAAAVGLPNPKDQDTPVDPVPTIKEAENVTASDSDNTSSETDETDSSQMDQAEKDGMPESEEAGAGDGNVTLESQDKIENVTKVVEKQDKTGEQTTGSSEDIVENSKGISFDKKEDCDNFESKATGSSDGLDKLSQQIDDSDNHIVLESDRPSSLPVSENEEGEDSVELVGDLTKKIIDELIEEASNISGIDASKSDSNITERQISSGDGDPEGKVTPENEMSDASPPESKELNTGSLSAVETNANGKAQEECMSASTASDGFTEDKPSEEKAKQTKQAQSTNQNTEKKPEQSERKAETSSPKQTEKNKKKENESTEKSHPSNDEAKMQRTFIVIDLETTDFIRGSVMPHITQIAAVEKMSKAHFAVYTKPKIPISAGAQCVTGMRMDENGVMLVNGTPTPCIPILTAIQELCSWLKQFPNVVLIAHNGRGFDFRVLMTAVQKTNMQAEFLEAVSGFVDSYDVFRKKYPYQSMRQVDLVRNLLGRTYNAHNAVADADALRDLLDLFQADDISRLIFSHSYVRNLLSL